MDYRFSRLRGGLRIGPAFLARHAAADDAGATRCRGLVDCMTDLATGEFDVERVHPAISVFFEDTAALELQIRSRWVFPFSLLWLVLRPFMRILGQFVLPWRDARIDTRVMGIDRDRDGRPDARGIIRAYEGSSQVMQVAVYATCADAEGRRYMSAMFPMPGGSVTGILRLERGQDEDEAGYFAVTLTSSPRADYRDDPSGLWLVIASWAMRAPLAERIDLWAPEMKTRPASIDPQAFPGATIVGQHEQRLFGIRFVRHDYWFRPRASAATA